MAVSIPNQISRTKILTCPICKEDVEADAEIAFSIGIGEPEGEMPTPVDAGTLGVAVTGEIIGIHFEHTCGTAEQWPMAGDPR